MTRLDKPGRSSEWTINLPLGAEQPIAEDPMSVTTLHFSWFDLLQNNPLGASQVSRGSKNVQLVNELRI